MTQTIISIENYAFYRCSSLYQIQIPYSIISLGDNIFDSIKNIVLSKQRINSFLIYNKLTLCLIISKQNANIDDTFNQYKSKIKQIILLSIATSIDNDAFSGCISLNYISIPFSVTSIGNYAFNNFSSLKKRFIPSSVISIGEYSFNSCSSLKGKSEFLHQ